MRQTLLHFSPRLESLQLGAYGQDCETYRPRSLQRALSNAPHELLLRTLV